MNKLLTRFFFVFVSKQIQLKDLLRPNKVKTTILKGNSLMELMKLKPPPDIAPPVATATATGAGNLFEWVGGKEVFGFKLQSLGLKL